MTELYRYVCVACLTWVSGMAPRHWQLSDSDEDKGLGRPLLAGGAAPSRAACTMAAASLRCVIFIQRVACVRRSRAFVSLTAVADVTVFDLMPSKRRRHAAGAGGAGGAGTALSIL
jgi:hypothetical protein